VSVAPDEEELYYVGTQGVKVTLMKGMDALVNMKSLTLRSNLIQKVEGMSTMNELTYLELYDNLIKKIENIDHLSKLRY
jgi:protein phosphatase 1 regulatory subunit 7